MCVCVQGCHIPLYGSYQKMERTLPPPRAPQKATAEIRSICERSLPLKLIFDRTSTV